MRFASSLLTTNNINQKKLIIFVHTLHNPTIYFHYPSHPPYLQMLFLQPHCIYKHFPPLYTWHVATTNQATTSSTYAMEERRCLVGDKHPTPHLLQSHTLKTLFYTPVFILLKATYASKRQPTTIINRAQLSVHPPPKGMPFNTSVMGHCTLASFPAGPQPYVSELVYWIFIVRRQLQYVKAQYLIHPIHTGMT